MIPSFKAIRYFERLTNTSFLELELHPELIFHLMYSCLLAHPENNFRMTFEEAMASFIPEHADELAEQLSIELNIIGQFNKEMTSSEDDSSISKTEKSSPNKEEKLFLSSLIPVLVSTCNLDLDYVMNEFDYTDTKMFIENSVERKHEDMENERFWTYLQIAPHLGSKTKIKKPEDLVEFTWEKEERKEYAEKKMKLDRQRLIEIGLIKVDDKEEETLTEQETT